MEKNLGITKISNIAVTILGHLERKPVELNLNPNNFTEI